MPEIAEDRAAPRLLTIELTVNGERRRLHAAPADTLLDLLRKAGYASVKRGCDEGDCGSCSVLVDGVLMRACLLYAGQAHGRAVTTVEALGTARAPHPIQRAFVEAGAVQCGFCTPGVVMSAVALLRQERAPSERRIREALAGNLCRCTGYARIVRAIERVREGER